MKKPALYFVLCILFFALTAAAQQTEKFDPAKDKEDFHGYEIHLLPVPGNTFGFMIVKDKVSVWSQVNNPFVADGRRGFAKKSEAYRLAEWVVTEKETNNHMPIAFKPELAKQLAVGEGSPKP